MSILLSTFIPIADEVTKTFIAPPLSTGYLFPSHAYQSRAFGLGYMPARPLFSSGGFYPRSYSLTGSFEAATQYVEKYEKDDNVVIDELDIATFPQFTPWDEIRSWYLDTYMPQHHPLSGIFALGAQEAISLGPDPTYPISSFLPSADTFGCKASFGGEYLVGSLSSLYDKTLHPTVRKADITDVISLKTKDDDYHIYLTETVRYKHLEKNASFTARPSQRLGFSYKPINMETRFGWKTRAYSENGYSYPYSTAGKPVEDQATLRAAFLDRYHYRHPLSGIVEDTSNQFGFSLLGQDAPFTRLTFNSTPYLVQDSLMLHNVIASDVVIYFSNGGLTPTDFYNATWIDGAGISSVYNGGWSFYL